MSKVFQLLGESFANKNGESIALTTIKGPQKVIALYFSAHWCPPCRAFTPKLAKFYKNVKESSNGDKFELLFVSSDKSEGEFTEYLSWMPWFALPYSKRSEKAKLSKHFKVSGIPTLIFLDGETGKVLNKNGRSSVDSDPEGKHFPWRSEMLHDMLKKGEYFNNKYETKSFEEDIKGKVLGIYFSAHWCPPCKQFTPALCETYLKINAGDDAPFEIIFVSSDESEDAFKEYFAAMPFVALAYDDEIKDDLSDYFEVDGIPALIIVDGDGTVITSNGRAAVTGDQEGKKFPWKPEPVEVLNEITGPKINEEACLIYNAAGDVEACEKMKTILTPIAKEHQEVTKAEDGSQELFFFVSDGRGSQVLESLCDFLNINHNETFLFIVDVPSGKIYKCESTGFAKEDVEEFIKDYLDDKLVPKNIRE